MTATPALAAHHLATLRGIDPAVIRERGYFTANSIMDIKRLGFRENQCGHPALILPTWNVLGERDIYLSRPDTSRNGPQGKIIKYEMPRGARMVVDVPPRARRFRGDPTTPAFITEGVKKADSGVSNGLDFCIDLLGVWNFKGTNEDGGKTVLADFDHIAWNGRDAYLTFDSDVMEKIAVYRALARLKAVLERHGARVHLLYLPAGPDGAKVGLDDFFAAGHGRDDLLALATDTLKPPPDDGEPEHPYRVAGGGFVMRQETQFGPQDKRLTNFLARIDGDLAEDDGVEVRRALAITAELGERRRAFRLPVEQFQAMNWPMEQLGATAFLAAGMGTKDHARAAIQLLSGEIPEHTVYTHLGWREHDGAWAYLHGGGAIGAGGPVPGVEVAPPGDLARFALPDPPPGEDLVAAVRASLNIVAVGPETVTIPALAATYRAALGGTDFSLGLVGPTGAGKSGIAALMQQHYGAGLDARSLPANWSSTANALESLLFHAKDSLLVIDDFAPGGSQNDVQRLHRDADRILRGQGNHAGRQRMTADIRIRQGKPSRCLPLMTGEDVPRGQSARARALIIEIGPGDVRWARLGECQRAASAGTSAAAMAGFIRWVAPQYPALQERLAAETLRLRELAATSAAHRRTPAIVASLAADWQLFLDFAVECGAITAVNAASAWRRGWAALGQAAAAQASHQASSEPTARFLELLGSALASGKAHVADQNGNAPKQARRWGWRGVLTSSAEYEQHEWRPQGARVGWVDGEDLYLDRDAALAEAQRLGRDTGDGLTITAQILTKRLNEKGLLASIDQASQSLIVRRTLEGKQRRVLHLAVTTLAPAEVQEPAPLEEAADD